ncbi:MAG: c-type cytochrome domain-containing protein, partial [Verrucomicrobiota bacterium]
MKSVLGMKSLRSMAASVMATLGCAGVLPAPVWAADAGMEFFEQKVRPLLADHCLGCHGGGPGEPKGGLRLDSKAGWEKGGANGPVIRVGRAFESPLLKAVRRQPGVEAMPPDGDGRRALTQQEAGVL